VADLEEEVSEDHQEIKALLLLEAIILQMDKIDTEQNPKTAVNLIFSKILLLYLPLHICARHLIS
jgi:hypothetical protein